MLTDLIGVAIGFVVVMLLLSLIVTSLSQATQSLLRLRGRNLRFGIAAALAGGTAPPDKDRLNEASDILNRSSNAGLNRSTNPLSFLSRAFGSVVGWIDSEALAEVLRERAKEMVDESKAKLSDEAIDETVSVVVKRFERLEKPLKNRFETYIRGISLCWALVVAAVFQVSAPALIHDLSINPELRAQLIAEVPILLEGQNGDEEDSENTAENADNNANTSNVEALDFETAVAAAENRIDQLALINVTPLRYGEEFYIGEDAVSNILGVLLTAVLLTLGAPFWYDALREVVRWRNVFSPSSKPSEPQNQQQGQQQGQQQDQQQTDGAATDDKNTGTT